jgi:hypothetical protein
MLLDAGTKLLSRRTNDAGQMHELEIVLDKLLIG